VKAEPPKHDIAKMGTKLRAQTCALLRLDPDKLSPGDEVLVARVGALKLLVSDLEAAQLRGEKIDLSTYVAASRELEQALRVDHQMAELGTLAGQERMHAELEDKFRAIIGASPKDPDDPGAELSEVEQLRRRVAELEAENLRLRWGDAPPPAEQAAPEPASETAQNVLPFAPLEQPKYHSTRAVDGRPPVHYLRDDTAGGAIVPPYFPLDPYR
jgi:hypothetical protein